MGLVHISFLGAGFSLSTPSAHAAAGCDQTWEEDYTGRCGDEAGDPFKCWGPTTPQSGPPFDVCNGFPDHGPQNDYCKPGGTSGHADICDGPPTYTGDQCFKSKSAPYDEIAGSDNCTPYLPENQGGDECLDPADNTSDLCAVDPITGNEVAGADECAPVQGTSDEGDQCLTDLPTNNGDVCHALEDISTGDECATPGSSGDRCLYYQDREVEGTDLCNPLSNVGDACDQNAEESTDSCLETVLAPDVCDPDHSNDDKCLHPENPTSDDCVATGGTDPADKE